jgi:hypothetical protein
MNQLVPAAAFGGTGAEKLASTPLIASPDLAKTARAGGDDDRFAPQRDAGCQTGKVGFVLPARHG